MRSSRLRMRDLQWLARIGWLLMLLVIQQRRASLPDLIRTVDAVPGKKRATGADVQRLVWLVRAVLRRVYGRAFCLQQSLLLFYFLRRWNHPVRIHFGVVKRDGALTGHAWLELDGQPVADARDPGLVFKTSFSYPTQPHTEGDHATRSETHIYA